MEEQKKSVVIDGVEYVPKVADKFPERGQFYFFIDGTGLRGVTKFSDNSQDLRRKTAGNCFRTEEEADLEILRRECMATRFVPENDDIIWFFNGWKKPVWKKIKSREFHSFVLLGLAAPTEEEAKARWDKYNAAWLEVLKTKK